MVKRGPSAAASAVFGLLLSLGVGCSDEEDSSPTTATGSGTAGAGGATGGAATGGNGGAGGEAGSSTLYDPLPVDLPACDPSDDEVAFISSDADWASIDDTDRRVFCVAPGDYRQAGTNGLITVQSSGSADAPRVLRYWDASRPDDDTHPVQMAAADRAILSVLVLHDASYWIIDRLTLAGSPEPSRIEGDRDVDEADFVGSHHNILNRLLVEDSENQHLEIYEGCHHNSIQRSVLRRTRPVPHADRISIGLMAWRGRLGRAEIFGTRIVGNEIYDATDGIQLFDHDQITVDPDYGGTIIADNDLYITPALYSDGNGTLDPNGSYAGAEDAIDIKAASRSAAPNRWIHIVGNRMWGFRYCDTAVGSTGGGGGGALVLHRVIERGTEDSGHVLIRGNIFMDAGGGMGVQRMHHVSIVDNVFFDLDKKGVDSPSPAGALSIGPGHHEIYGNTIVDVYDTAATNPSGINDAEWLRALDTVGDTAFHVDLRCNQVLASPIVTCNLTEADNHVTADYNAYFDAAQLALPGAHDVVGATAAESANEELCFTRKRLTAPEQVCIPLALPSPTSPHADGCDPDLGSVPDVGVDDEPVTLDR